MLTVVKIYLYVFKNENVFLVAAENVPGHLNECVHVALL